MVHKYSYTALREVTGVQAGGRAEEFNAANPAHALKVGDTVVQVCGSQDIINVSARQVSLTLHKTPKNTAHSI